MNYLGIAFVADNYNKNRLMEILERKIGNKDIAHKNGLYNKYSLEICKNKPWFGEYIKTVIDIYDFIPGAIAINNEYGETLFFKYIYTKESLSIDLKNMNYDEWETFVKQMYSYYSGKYAVLIKFET